MYNVKFLSLTRMKIGIFLFLFILWFAGSSYYVYSEETVHWAPIELFIPSLVFVTVVFYVFAAFLEFAFYQARKKWPRWF